MQVVNLIEVLKSKKAIVVRTIDEAPGVKTFALKLSGEYDIKPGQFSMLYYWGIGEAPISLANLPLKTGSSTIIEHTVRSTGVVTNTIVENARIGSVLGVRGPYGKGWPLEKHENMNIVIIAGGIGLAPLRPVIKYIEKNREKYKDVYLLYGARTPADMLYKYEHESYSRMPGLKVLLSSDVRVEGWSHHVGFVTDLVKYVDVRTEETVAYVCGPEVMMRVAVKKLLDKGFRKDNIFLSLERRMRCGVGICGTCQFGHYFVCRDGPVFSYSEIEDYLWIEGV
ncbi:MAG: FAD/NAD(P)-binding protein [Desulfurococcaceae archaeon]